MWAAAAAGRGGQRPFAIPSAVVAVEGGAWQNEGVEQPSPASPPLNVSDATALPALAPEPVGEGGTADKVAVCPL